KRIFRVKDIIIELYKEIVPGCRGLNNQTIISLFSSLLDFMCLNYTLIQSLVILLNNRYDIMNDKRIWRHK
ncbi:MAG: hypothetical protein ACP5JP_08475, partial [bacterium]